MSTAFDKPWVLLCEGKGDVEFYKLLLKEHNLESNFQIEKPQFKPNHDGGRGSFGHYLKDLRLNPSWRKAVKAVLIVSDNDADPAESFAEVQADLKNAPGYGVPDKPGIAAKSTDGLPSVIVMMVPIDSPGSLETLCLQPAYDNWPDILGPLDDFVSRTPAKDFTLVKQAKMRLQSLLSSTNEKNPDFGFAAHWKCKDRYRIPIKHASFDPIVSFLKNFEVLISEAV